MRALYRWRVKPGHEDDFIRHAAQTTKERAAVILSGYDARYGVQRNVAKGYWAGQPAGLAAARVVVFSPATILRLTPVSTDSPERPHFGPHEAGPKPEPSSGTGRVGRQTSEWGAVGPPPTARSAAALSRSS